MQRGFWGTLFMIAALVSLPVALLSSLITSLSSGQDFNQILKSYVWFGILFGLLFGFIIAYYMKAYSIQVVFEDKPRFLVRLDEAAKALGFQPGFQTETLLTFSHPIPTALLAGDIAVYLHEGFATITGPAGYVKKLEKFLS